MFFLLFFFTAMMTKVFTFKLQKRKQLKGLFDLPILLGKEGNYKAYTAKISYFQPSKRFSEGHIGEHESLIESDFHQQEVFGTRGSGTGQ